MKKRISLLAVLFAVGGLLATGLFSDSQPVSTPEPLLPIKTSEGAAVLQNVQPEMKPRPLPVPESKTGNRTENVATAASRQTSYPERMVSSGVFAVGNQQYLLRKYKALMTPNDPSATQWWVTQTGLPAAWDHTTGANTKIAIIDTGFALQHEEFSGRWLDNSAESGTAATNGVDDDNNGFVDDFRGWDFDSDESSVQAGEENATGSGVSHASSVAGVAGAIGNNSLGIAGVSWGAKILPLQALSDNGSGTTLSVARAVRYAADRNVDVINLSLGSDEEDSYLRQAIQYALEKGVIVVAAAGNDGCECIAYPARYPEVVAVGASNSSGTTTSFSSYGDNLDIVAPGSGIRAPSWSQAVPTNGYAASVAGTSFSSPYISGLLANGRAKQPNASWGQLLNVLLQTADHRTQTSAAPRSKTIGFGYVKADNFIARTSNPYIQPIRYSFGLSLGNTLGAPTANECEGGQMPSAPFYEIRQGSLAYYSVSELTAHLQRTSGSTVTQKGFVCTGLPTDQITQQLRSLDPVREFSNISNKL